MAKKNRSGGLLAVVLAVTVVGVVLALPDGGPDWSPVDVTTEQVVPVKPGVQYIIIKSGEKLPADIKPPLEVHVAGVSAAECEKMGGTYQAPSGSRTSICLDVDY
jgi:hypothetical protein